jgi:hypothetical protein
MSYVLLHSKSPQDKISNTALITILGQSHCASNYHKDSRLKAQEKKLGCVELIGFECLAFVVVMMVVVMMVVVMMVVVMMMMVVVVVVTVMTSSKRFIAYNRCYCEQCQRNH